jgi:hypothetical protein
MWCEPLPPQKWNGSKKVRAEIANGNHTVIEISQLIGSE